MSTATAAPVLSKTHYTVLDGLRGVASLLVVLFHILEPYANGDNHKLMMNHGYLAVDFFFLLSGFVIAYAYDDRWGRMSQWEFYKRRLIRLQPMVILGSIVGAVLFYFAKGPVFPPIASTPVSTMLLVMLIGFTLIPVPTSMDIRGWGEMHPLDGPCWSLFFEYIGNILYAIGLRKLSNRVLGVFVALSAVFLLHMAMFYNRGDVVGGWSLTWREMHVGFARLLFPFFAGILLMRLGKRIRVKHSFAVCSLLLIVCFALPRFGDRHHEWINGLYEGLSIVLLFPLIVAIGAGEMRVEGLSIRIARFFGNLSYPLYISHYPLIYIFWAVRSRVPFAQGAIWGVVVFFVAVALAYAYLKLYDEPVRRWLTRRFLAKPA